MPHLVKFGLFGCIATTLYASLFLSQKIKSDHVTRSPAFYIVHLHFAVNFSTHDSSPLYTSLICVLYICPLHF